LAIPEASAGFALTLVETVQNIGDTVETFRTCILRMIKGAAVSQERKIKRLKNQRKAKKKRSLKITAEEGAMMDMTIWMVVL
jgi:hypothetical protein